MIEDFKTICGKCGNRFKHKKDCPINISEVLMRKRPKNLVQLLFKYYWIGKLLND
jgi:hypothetical protein